MKLSFSWIPSKQPERMEEDKTLILTVCVVADTHVPDRCDRLHPSLTSTLEEIAPQWIFHAGDICSDMIIKELTAVAPVKAIRGNRDFMMRQKLSRESHFEIGGLNVSLVHGHGGLISYIQDKISHIFHGYEIDRYLRIVRKTSPKADVIIFGHTHRVVNQTKEGVVYFNPGSAALPFNPDTQLPSFGILKFFTHGIVEGQIVPLRGFALKHGRWEKI